jgi:hypothetical protein
MNIEVKKSPYTSKLGGYIDITFSTDIELSISTNGYHWIGLPNMNIQDLKELRKSIRKYIKENKQ